MDRLDQVIADKRAELKRAEAEANELVRRRDRLGMELGILEEAARLRPAHSSSTRHGESNGGKTRGRQKGAISHQWRAVLGEMYAGELRRTYPEILEIASKHGIRAQLPGIRDRVRHFVQLGLMDGRNEVRGFRVTDVAATRFGFARKDEAPAA